jgi:hypothetical protein
MRENIQLFISDELHQKVNKYGAVKIPFLSAEQVVELNAFYNELHPNGELQSVYDDLHMTSWCSDYDYKMKIKKKIAGMFDAAIQNIFKEYRTLNHIFIVKNQGKHTEFNLHQDWSVVDETKYPSYNIWVPLKDIKADSGCMRIVHGSHKLKSVIRGARNLYPDYSNLTQELSSHITQYEMKAGEALVFFHNTIHGSPPNLTEKQRVVATASVIPKDALLQINFNPMGEDNINVYNPVDDFMFLYDELRKQSFQHPPKGPLIKSIPLSAYLQPTLDDIKACAVV